ncbi:MAG: outer membrane beta-barrel protein [Asticcacaulis sp.]
MSFLYCRDLNGAEGVPMSYKTAFVAVLAAAAGMLPLTVHAQDSSFARDRNVAVMQRIPAGYEPLGLRAGSFNVAPKLDIGLEKNDNIYYQPIDKTGDAILDLAPSVLIKSDWGRHELVANLNADYNSFEKHSRENTLAWDAGLAGRLDIHGATYAFAGADFSQNYEPRYAPSSLALISSGMPAKPIKFDADQAKIGIVTELNRLKFTGRADYAYYNYFDARSVGGAIIDQDVRDYTWTSWQGQADYAVSPDTAVYAVLTSNTRNYRVSNARDSHGTEFAVGADFDITNLVRGSLQVGYLEQKYKNPIFKPAKDPSFKAQIEYFPSQMTTVNFTASRTVQETPSIKASGYLSSVYSIGVDHELLRNFVLSASYETIQDRYNGIDRRDNRNALNLGGRYLVSRNVVLRAGYTYRDLTSKGTSGDIIPSFKDNLFKVSLGLQY